MKKVVFFIANIYGSFNNLTPVSKDRIYIVLTCTGLLYCFQKYDAFESLITFTRQYEHFEVDEFFLLLMSTPLILIFFNLRKNKYLQNEISRRIDVENKIKKLAFYDGLTGLANRELCNEHLNQRLSQAKRSKNKAAVLFIDLDNFKEINDSYGHPYGDELLIQFSKRIASELRDDSSLSRISGDEFIILLGAIDEPTSIGALAERLLSILSLPFSLHGHDAYVGMSIGIAVYPEDETTATGLIKQADIAMYHAKSEGKNTYRFFSEQLDQQAKDKFSVRTHLKKALENKEFSLVYQPIINTASQKLTGAEALLRWYNPELGNVPPDVFIPIAEENGLISKIGDWVLLEACKQNKQWQCQGYDPIVMSVNMSARQLGYDKYISSVINCLKSSQLESKYLELELTETTIMKNINMAIERLNLLNKLGIKLALDDFGTGYSSMGYINQLKLNRLKIDRCFIDKISDNPENVITLNAIISLAKNLRLEITAEGVETAEQLDFIANTACDSVQGFFYSKPVSADNFEAFLIDPQFKNSEFPILLSLPTTAFV